MLDGFSRGLILFFAVSLAVVSARGASFTASLDRDAISLGETATLSLKFEGGSPEQLPSSLTVSNLQLVLIGRPMHFDVNINGNATSYDTFSYVVTPTQAGTFTIPALTAKVGGQMLTSQPLTLTVSQPGAPAVAAGDNPGSQIAFARLTLPRKPVYVGETITADLQLFYRQDAQLAQRPQLSSMPADGFAVGKVAGDNQTATQIGNAVYNVIPAKIVLTADRTGTLHFGPVTISLVLLVQAGDRQPDFMDPFGIFGRTEQKNISVATGALDVNSLPLPTENVPANFNGAVGDYTLTVTAGPTNVAVGDPITIRAQIAGRGAIDTLRLPDQAGWDGFKLFPPTSKVETTGPLAIEGAKTFEEIVTPQSTDVHALPAISFSYFNPDDGQYHVLTQPSLALAVHSAGSTPLPALAASKNAAPENQPPQDILPIRDELGTLVPAGAPLVTRPAFVAVQSVPVIAFLAALLWRKRADHLANHPRLRRRRAVAQLVAAGIEDLNRYAAANQPDEFFATLFRLLQEQLGERLDCPASSITEQVVDEHPALRGAPESLLEGLRELFQLCNQARYAPVRGSAELNSVAAQFATTIGELQRHGP